MLRNTQNTYGSIAKFFHWLIALLVIGMLLLGYFMDDFPKNYQGNVFAIHKLTGMTILILMVLRVLWALINPKPILLEVQEWERWAERSVHFLLYATLLAMPLLGWMGSSASGRPPTLAGFSMSFPIEHSKPLAHTLMDWHGNVAILIIALLCVHILAALYHYYIRKDKILQRMLPSCCSRN